MSLLRIASSNTIDEKHRTEVANIANQTAYNISNLLDNLLQEYDNSLRPDFGGEWLLTLHCCDYIILNKQAHPS